VKTRHQLAYLDAAHFCCHYFLLIFPTAVIAIGESRGLAYGEALALGTPLYVFFAIGTLPAGWLGDQPDCEHLISLFFVGCGGASMLIGFARDDFWFMTGLGALGLFAAIYHPVGLSMVTRLTSRPGRALAVNGVFGNLGLAGASLSTGLLADTFGWRSAFLVPGAVAIAIGVAHLLSGRRTTAIAASPDASRSPGMVMPRPIQFRVFGVVLFAALFSGIAFNGVTISLPKLFDERLGALAPSLSGVSGYTTFVFGLAAFGQLPIGRLLDHLGGRSVMLALFVLAAGALAGTSQASGWLVVPSALATVTLLFASIPITGWLLSRYVAASWRSRAFAVEYVLALGVGSLVVPTMAALHQAGHGFNRQYLLFMLSAIAVAAGALILPRSSPFQG
jgi:MFS family permease